MTKSGILGAFAFILLGACAANTVTSDVTRFHQLPSPGGESVAVVAADERIMNSIEFDQYARTLIQNLVRQGFRAPTGEPPDYIAVLDFYQRPIADDYDQDGSSVSVGVGGGSGGYRSGVGVGIGTSFDLSGPRDEIAMRTVTLHIDRREDGQRLFEARARSKGPAGNFPNAVPYMIDAIFDGFPGQNGTTITVETPVK